MKKILVLCLAMFMFSKPCLALDINKLTIKVDTVELNLKENKFNYSILTVYDKKEVEITVNTSEDVKILGDGVIKLEEKVTKHDIKIIQQGKEYTYHLTFTKEEQPKNPDDLGITIFFNCDNINDILARKNNPIFYESMENVSLFVRSDKEDVEVTTKLGIYNLKEKETTIPVTVKTKMEEYTYNINVIKIDSKEKNNDKTMIILIIKNIISIICLIASLVLLFKEHSLIWLLLILVSILSLVLVINMVDGSSMENTFHDKEQTLGIFSAFTSFKRGDIITAYINDYKNIGKELVIKRVIGIPHDTIKIKNNVLYVNGQKQEESYIKEKMDTWDLEITLGDDEYFIMGDNRNNSYDSRVYGAIKRNQIISKILFK